MAGIRKVGKYDDEIKEYAKSLYMIPDETGLSRKFNNNVISLLINKKFDIQTSSVNICAWETRNGWAEEFRNGLRTVLEDVDIDLFLEVSQDENSILTLKQERLKEAEDDFQETFSMSMKNGVLIAKEVHRRLMSQPEKFSDKVLLEAHNSLLSRLIELQKLKMESELMRNDNDKEEGLPGLLENLKQSVLENNTIKDIIYEIKEGKDEKNSN